MLTEERHRLILQALKEKEIVKISELTALTDASESTIRRDLTWLEEKKFLKRIHGGAVRLQGKLTELSVPEKSSKNIQEKSKSLNMRQALWKMAIVFTWMPAQRRCK